MVLGLAFIPGGNATYIYEYMTNRSYSLCNTSFQSKLISAYDAKIAIFNLRADRLELLSVPYASVLYSMINSSIASMSVIAFAGQIYSPPIYVASIHPNYTVGVGFATSAPLLLRFSSGNLTYMQWYDQTCTECGGRNGSLCLNSKTASVYNCATAVDNCTCVLTDGKVNASCSYTDGRFNVCSTSIYVAWSGTDSSLATFKTGPMIEKLNSYSLVSLFNKGVSYLSSWKTYVVSQANSTWSLLTTTTTTSSDLGGGFSDLG